LGEQDMLWEHKPRGEGHIFCIPTNL